MKVAAEESNARVNFCREQSRARRCLMHVMKLLCVMTMPVASAGLPPLVAAAPATLV